MSESISHILYLSNRIQGRFALDSLDGLTLSSFQPIRLKLGNYWLSGHVETGHETSYFVADGGNFLNDHIALREGLTVAEVE